MMAASHILRPIGALLVHILRNQRYTSWIVMNDSMGTWQDQGWVGTSAVTTMAESFDDKLIDQVCNYPHLYDVSLPLHSDKYA